MIYVYKFSFLTNILFKNKECFARVLDSRSILTSIYNLRLHERIGGILKFCTIVESKW